MLFYHSTATLLKLLAFVFIIVHYYSAFVLSQQDFDNVTSTITDSDSDLLHSSENENNLLFTNYNALRKDGQGFFLNEANILYENPGRSLVPFVSLYWWCDLKFLSDDDGNNYNGYVGRSVVALLGSTLLEDVLAQGAETPTLTKKRAESVSAVFVPALGIFEGQIHPTHNDDNGNVKRFWDNGNSEFPFIGWKGGHDDEGVDTTSTNNADNTTSGAFSNAGKFIKITKEEAAKYLGMDESEMTPEMCSKKYKEAWDDETHKPTPDPINTTTTIMTTQSVQLQADNDELMYRIASIEEGLQQQIDMTMITLEEEIAILQAYNDELMYRLASIEANIAANNGGSGGGGY